MWSKFHFFCGIAVPRTQTTAFACYGYHFICMPGVFHGTKEDNAKWFVKSVIVALISLWKLKFLAYMLNVTQRFVMRIISYANLCISFLFNYFSWQWLPFIESATH